MSSRLMTRNGIFQAIERELAHQTAKYGSPAQRNLRIADYMEIADDEFLKAMDALADGEIDNALCEALQAAAVLVAMLERHGVVERPRE